MKRSFKIIGTAVCALSALTLTALACSCKDDKDKNTEKYYNNPTKDNMGTSDEMQNPEIDYIPPYRTGGGRTYVFLLLPDFSHEQSEAFAPWHKHKPNQENKKPAPEAKDTENGQDVLNN